MIIKKYLYKLRCQKSLVYLRKLSNLQIIILFISNCQFYHQIIYFLLLLNFKYIFKINDFDYTIIIKIIHYY